MQGAVGGDVRGENGAVSAVEAVALLLGPVWQVCSSVVLVNDAELGNIIDTCEHSDAICRGRVLSVHKSELVIGQLLFLGHDVLGELQQRILVSPEQLPNGNFHEWLNLENVHNTSHGQSKKPVMTKNQVI